MKATSLLQHFLSDLLLILATGTAFSQSQAEYIRQNAVPFMNTEQLPDQIYDQLSNFPVIMVGEMHGSNEPAQLVRGLVKLFRNKGEKVLLGLEIPPDEMNDLTRNPADSLVYESSFFQKSHFHDGRQSFAWAKTITAFLHDTGVKIFFFDIHKNQQMEFRDSVMYRTIRAECVKYPNTRIITLSGNAHTLSDSGEQKAARFIQEDTSVTHNRKICTIYHYYQQGTCRANFGNGLEEKSYDRQAGDLDTLLPGANYLLKTSSASSFHYTYIFYTNKITAAEQVIEQPGLSAIKTTLTELERLDQRTRIADDSAAYRSQIDSSNLAIIEKLINRYGWMGKSLIGISGNHTQWLLIQHAPYSVQNKYLSLLESSVNFGESRSVDLAYLEDRIRMNEGRKQRYGTQLQSDEQGVFRIYPIEDEEHVDERRRELGLPTMEEYAKRFGLEYVGVKPVK